MTYLLTWKPPLITHLLDMSTHGELTLCGLRTETDWGEGDEFEGHEAVTCTCLRCKRIAKARAAQA